MVDGDDYDSDDHKTLRFTLSFEGRLTATVRGFAEGP